jgi:hypothetical protein
MTEKKSEDTKKAAVPEGISVPKAVLAEKKPHDPSRVEVGASYTDGINPGMNAQGLVLDHSNYIRPDESMDYKFCSLRDTHVARNRVKGWKPVTVDGRDIVAGRMQLCQRPKDIGERQNAEHVARVEAQRKRAGAHAQARKHDLTSPMESES